MTSTATWATEDAGGTSESSHVERTSSRDRNDPAVRSWRAIIVSSNGLHEAACLELSRGEHSLALARPPRAGEVVGITLFVPGAGEFDGRASVTDTSRSGRADLRWIAVSMRLAWLLEALCVARAAARAPARRSS